MATDYMYNDIDMRIPKFLRRKPTKASRAMIDRILAEHTRARDWAPIRKLSEIPARPTMPLMTDHPDLPVKVQVKGKQAGSTLLATYANMAEFEAKHNKATYPVKGQPYSFATHTVILVTTKPWAGKDNVVKREGPKASAVYVDGVLHDSVLAAFQTLKLPVSKHQKFRAELKKARAMPFEHDGKPYAFSYDKPATPEFPSDDHRPKEGKVKRPRAHKSSEEKLMKRLAKKKKKGKR